MKTLYLERSTGDSRTGDWVGKLDLDGIGRIVVGTGPGSFAGIRAAIAFANGYKVGRPEVEVLGLPSPCAIAAQLLGTVPQKLGTVPQKLGTVPQNLGTDPQKLGTDPRIAVVGDARQGKVWVALFKGYLLEKDVFQVNISDLMGTVPPEKGTVPPGYVVVSPDDRRIGAKLREIFAERYLGEVMPTAEGLEAFAGKCPENLKAEPLPIYLNPAVRN